MTTHKTAASDIRLSGLTARLKASTSDTEREQLWELLFPILKRNARSLAGPRGESATELVTELWPALQRALDDPNRPFASRGRFFAYAQVAFRHHLLSKSKKHPDGLEPEHTAAPHGLDTESFLALTQALDKLAQSHPLAAKAFVLRYGEGFSAQEIYDACDEYRAVNARVAVRRLQPVYADLKLARRRLAKLLRPLTVVQIVAPVAKEPRSAPS